jgi:hypothetical protein
MKTYIDNLFVAIIAFGVAITFLGAVADDLNHDQLAPAADIIACDMQPHSLEV